MAGFVSCTTTSSGNIDDDTKLSMDIVKKAKEKIDAVSNVMFRVMESTDSSGEPVLVEVEDNQPASGIRTMSTKTIESDIRIDKLM